MGKNWIGLLEILDEGETLRLSNGSLFRVDPFDLHEVCTWAVANEIEMAVTKDQVFNYTLINRDIATWIRAMKLN